MTHECGYNIYVGQFTSCSMAAYIFSKNIKTWKPSCYNKKSSKHFFFVMEAADGACLKKNTQIYIIIE